MRERPILFSGPMVRAILEGRKTQTRRVVKPQPDTTSDGFARVKIGPHTHSGPTAYLLEKLAQFSCPFGQPSDRLWVRETWAPMCRVADPYCECETPEAIAAHHYVEYRADTDNPYPGDWPAEEARENEDAPRWRPSIHMPRPVARLLLDITGVRIERLCQISQDDALAEGIEYRGDRIQDGRMTGPNGKSLTGEFRDLWDALNAKRGHGWDANPWVWVIEFEVLPNG